jgi:hypothetical protein
MFLSPDDKKLNEKENGHEDGNAFKKINKKLVEIHLSGVSFLKMG